MLNNKKIKTKSIKNAVKKAKHQPKYIRAVFERVTLRLAFLALLGSILFSGFRFYQGRQQNVNAANEVKQQSDHKKLPHRQRRSQSSGMTTVRLHMLLERSMVRSIRTPKMRF